MHIDALTIAGTISAVLSMVAFIGAIKSNQAELFIRNMQRGLRGA